MLSSSPLNEGAPGSAGMARKRTLQDMANPMDDGMSSTNSSPLSLIPSFEFDPAHALHSSPYSVTTLASSPMSLTFSNSSQSSYGGSGCGDADYDFDLADEHDPFEGGAQGRPDMKRRRTAPEMMDGSPPHSMREESQSPSDKRGNGKDGQDVWPQDAEDAFHTGACTARTRRGLLSLLTRTLLPASQPSASSRNSAARRSWSTANPVVATSSSPTTSGARRARFARASRSRATSRSSRTCASTTSNVRALSCFHRIESAHS